MAQVTGTICDVCDRFAVSREGWLRLTTAADKDAKGFDLCGNACLKKLANERVKGDVQNGGYKESHDRFYATWTDDQKLQLVAEALDSSVGAVAIKYGVPWQAVAKWKERLAG